MGVYKLEAGASLSNFEVFLDISTISPCSFSLKVDSILLIYVVGKASNEVSFFTTGEFDGQVNFESECEFPMDWVYNHTLL